MTARHGDLRELDLGERFPLVTGSPPYFPLGTGVLPDDDQKAHARFELRGDVADYARAAARHLADDGVFALCFPTPQRARASAALEGAGLAVLATRDVIPRATLRPLFTLWLARLGAARAPEIQPPLVVRTEDGALSAEMRGVRRRFDLTNPRDERPRPARRSDEADDGGIPQTATACASSANRPRAPARDRR